jgi:hypothetical protein
LLATTLCTIAEHDVPLPESEIRLYEERMRLMLGHYDVHKDISRITSQRTDLESAAQKIAFYLHRTRKRDAERSEMYACVVRALRLKRRERVSEVLVDELVDPCNVLVPMTDDGRIGFGHLRYQEYLVAKELIANRSLDVVQYLADDWWRGAMVLFARMSDSVQWLIERAIETMTVEKSARTLRAMAEVYPKDTKAEYIQLISEHLQLDEFMAAQGTPAISDRDWSHDDDTNDWDDDDG